MSSAFIVAPEDSKEVAGTHEGAPKKNLTFDKLAFLIINFTPSIPSTFAIS